MTPLTEFLELMLETAEQNCDLDNPISTKELPASGGIYAELGSGSTEMEYFDKSAIKIIPVLFLCRAADQQRCLEQLSSICEYFQRLKKYPQGSSFAWLNSEISKEPSKIGRDEDGVWHYSCILNNKIYY
ncbi:hypothetical protein [Diplocloster agilis]|nr:hypothetical protein [Diplocloster agilis]